MNRSFWIGVIVIVLGGGWWAYSATQSGTDATTASPSESSGVVETSTVFGELPEPPDTNGQSVGEQLGLAGKLATNYYIFNEENYQRIKDADQPHYLFFYANWCSTCAAQLTIDLPLFNELGADNEIVALRVNTIDDETDEVERALAQEFGVRFQHTMFLIDRNGEQVARFLGQTTKSQLLEAFEQVS